MKIGLNEIYENHEHLFEMGPYGSVWGDIKTGKRSMAHDHFQTPPDPQKTGGSLKKRFGGSGLNRLIRPLDVQGMQTNRRAFFP